MDDIFVRVYVQFFRSGLAAELGPQRAITLLAVATFMDENGYCYPSQETLASMTGTTERTVRRNIKSLLDYRWNNKPVIERVMAKADGAKYYHSEYKILPVAQIAKFNGTVSDIEDKNVQDKNVQGGHECPVNNKTVNNSSTSNNSNIVNIANRGKRPDPEPGPDLAEFQIKNSSDVCKYFAGRYQEKYGVAYMVNWKREASMVKTKLWGTYSPEQLRAIIDEVIENYDTRWGSREYPRPSIGQLCSWLANKAMAAVQEREKKEADLERRMEAGRSWEADERLERWLG
jgi:hypothetical protein